MHIVLFKLKSTLTDEEVKEVKTLYASQLVVD